MKLCVECSLTTTNGDGWKRTAQAEQLQKSVENLRDEFSRSKAECEVRSR